MKRFRTNTSYFLKGTEIHNLADFPLSVYSQKHIIIYEVIKLRAKLFFLPEHLDRLKRSVQNMGYTYIYDIVPKEKEIMLLFGHNDCKEGNVRIDYFPELNLSVSYLTPYFYPPMELYGQGVSLCFQFDERPNQHIKEFHSDLKKRTSAIIDNKGVFETLLVNQNNKITEGSRSNVFFIKNGLVYTPPVQDVLPGITRSALIAFLQSQSIKWQEKEIDSENIAEFESAFLTGTSIGALPIKQIEEQTFDTKNPLLQKIVNGFNHF
jgi:branched-chain amino acid aminotransferase